MNSEEKIILHLFADLGSDSLPYQEALGYKVILVGKDIGVENFHPPEKVYGIISNPLCTMFSTARSTPKEPRDLRKGMFYVNHSLRVIHECFYRVSGINHPSCPVKFWVIENPALGYLKWFLGNPTFTYQPYEYGESYSKKTSLWGMFNLPKKPLLHNPIDKGQSITYKKGVSRKARSICPYSFAKAFFEANQ